MSAERDRQLHQQRGAKRARTIDVPTPGSRGLRPVFNSSSETPSSQASTPSFASDSEDLRRRVPPSAPLTNFAASTAPQDPAPRPPPRHQLDPQHTPNSSEYPSSAPRPAHPLPRQPLEAPLPPGPSSYLPDAYRQDFGAASALGDFAFDFALPANSYDGQGGLQYHMGLSSHHLPTPPSYHTAYSTPSGQAHDVKPQLYDPYGTQPPSQRPYY